MGLRACEFLTGSEVPYRWRQYLGDFHESPGAQVAIESHVYHVYHADQGSVQAACIFILVHCAHVPRAVELAPIVDPAGAVTLHRRVV